MMSAPGPSEGKRSLWILWGSTAATMFISALLVRVAVKETVEGIYRMSEIRHLSPLGTWAVRGGPYLWVLALSLAAEGTRRALRNPPADTLRWICVALLAYAAIAFLCLYGLLRQLFLVPHDH